MKVASLASIVLLAAPPQARALDDGGYHPVFSKGAKSESADAKAEKFSYEGKSSKAMPKSAKSAKSAKGEKGVKSAKAYAKASKAANDGGTGGVPPVNLPEHGGSGSGSGGSGSGAPDAEAVRAMLRLYRDSLAPGLQLDRGYHASAADQVPNYNTCTIVQQCLDPEFILSLGLMDPPSRGHAYNSLSKVMSAESFNMLQLQQHGNMLLGEMQDWGTACKGHCRELSNPTGLLEPIVEAGLLAQSSEIPFLGYEACGNLRQEGNKTLWYCDEAPQMIHQANIDVATGKYFLGDIWNEPHIHGRNSWYDYFAAYGDLEEGGGAFGLRFSGHHMDINYRWNGDGELIDDLPVFLGHNPLIVPSVHPPLKRGFDERIVEDHHYTPLMWANMAGIAQFPEAVGLVLTAANKLLDIAPDAFVPLDQWESVGAFGALLPSGGRESRDFPGHFDLATASEEDFNTIWNLVDYTLKFSRGRRSTAEERAAFRADGRAIWTSQGDPEEGLPMSEDDIRSNMNFLKVRVETDDVLFFVMTNQLFCVISESEPTNHLHSIYMAKDMINADNACLDASSKVPGALCESKKVTDFVDEHEEMLISNKFKYESSKWEERSIKSEITLDVEAFAGAVEEWSDRLCGLGMTATLFDNNGDILYQDTVGSQYTPIIDEGYLQFGGGYGPLQGGWTGDTTFTPFSNAKGTAAAAFIASVVDTGLGYLDEPLYTTFTELPDDALVGLITPRMILSHTSGLTPLDRNDPENDPYYSCLYDDSKTMEECILAHVLTDANLLPEAPVILEFTGLLDESNSDAELVSVYNNEAFDILAVLAVRKTGMNSYGEIFQKYITEPLGMDDTTFDCPVLRSTLEKPHVGWGLCSTGNDFPKFAQMLVREGMSEDGVRVLSKYGVTQMFSTGGGNAIGNNDVLFGVPASPLAAYTLGRCYARMQMYEGVPFDLPVSSIEDYGLGTMVFTGEYGEIFGHMGSTGGGWFVAPGRFAIYLAWMAEAALQAPQLGSSYHYTSDIFHALESSSSFSVSSVFGEERFERIPACGGGMYDDLHQHLGIDATSEYLDSIYPSCSGRRLAKSSLNPLSKIAEEFDPDSAFETWKML